MSYSTGMGTLYAAAGLGAYNTPTPLSVRVVQRGLIVAGVSPSPGTPDNKWGPNTQASLSAWLTTEAGRHRISASDVRATFGNIAPRATTITLPNALASRLERLSGDYTSTTSGGTTTRRTSTTSTTSTTNGGATTNGNGVPSVANGNGIQLMDWLPWAIGGVAFVGIGAAFLLMPKKGARRPAVARNRRRRRSTRRRRRR